MLMWQTSAIKAEEVEALASRAEARPSVSSGSTKKAVSFFASRERHRKA